MTPTRRSPPRGPAGDSEDPTLQEIGTDATGSVAVKEQVEPGPVDEPTRSIAERFTDWRRHYLPLPDEVVTEYLGEDEYVIHTDHPSFRAFLIQNMVQVLIATALLPIVFAFVQMDLEWWWIFLIVLGLDLVLLGLAVRRLSDRYTSYVITNLRLIRLSGIIGRRLASIPWTRMTGLGFRQKPIGRLMGYATIFIESANEESGLREFSDINDPATFHQMILDMVSSKSGPKPAEPTKGVRKTLRQRRREARDALRQANETSVAEDQKPAAEAAVGAEAEPKATPATITDTAGPAEAMSTTEGRAAPKPATGRRPPPKPPIARARPAVTPPSGTPVAKPPVTEPPVTEPPVTKPPVTKPPVTKPPVTEQPVTERPAAAEQPAAANRPPTADRPAAANKPAADQRPAAAERPAASAERPAPEPPGPSARPRPQGARPTARPESGTPRPTGPAPATPSRQRLAGPRPARPASEPPGTRNRSPNWAWPGGGGQPRDQRTGRVAPEHTSEPLLKRIKRAASPLTERLKGAGKGSPTGGRVDPANEPLIETVSARDAIAAVRRGRTGRPIRRPRFPSFGRSRPTIPPSRQLPAASSNPRTRRGDDDSES